MFHILAALAALFVAARVLWPLPGPRLLRGGLIVVLLLASQPHLASKLFYGAFFSPEMPRPLMIAANLTFGFTFLAFGLQLCVDLLALLVALCRRRRPVVPRVLPPTVAAASLILACYAVTEATRLPAVRQVEVAIDGLAPEFDGYRIVQLTDLHLSKLFQRDRAAAVVVKANALDPDLIVITGDLIDGSIDARRHDIAPLADLRARDGVRVIPGNHEYYYGYPGWAEQFSSLGMDVLANRHSVIRRAGAELVIAGVTDRTALRMALPEPDITAALEGAPADAPVILLDHQPRFAVRNAAAGVDLQLSGHTHGGMILGFDRIVARFNEGFVSGLYRVGPMQLYVSNGTGLWAGFALRVGIPAEITSITLRRSDA